MDYIGAQGNSRPEFFISFSTALTAFAVFAVFARTSQLRT